jgi:hypothetical protein
MFGFTFCSCEVGEKRSVEVFGRSSGHRVGLSFPDEAKKVRSGLISLRNQITTEHSLRPEAQSTGREAEDGRLSLPYVTENCPLC